MSPLNFRFAVLLVAAAFTVYVASAGDLEYNEYTGKDGKLDKDPFGFINLPESVWQQLKLVFWNIANYIVETIKKMVFGHVSTVPGGYYDHKGSR